MTTLRLLSTALLTCAVASLPTATLRADEVVLKDGTTYVGKTRKLRSHLEVTTLDGKVRVELDKIDWQRTRNEQQLHQALARLALDKSRRSCTDQMRLAAAAKSWGLYEDMWRHLDFAMQASGSSKAGQLYIKSFLAKLEPVVLPKKYRKRTGEKKVQELLMRIKPRTHRSKAAAVAAVLAQVPNGMAELRKQARGNSHPRRRIAAVRALAAWAAAPTQQSLAKKVETQRINSERFVYRTALVDISADVRSAAMSIANEYDQAEPAIEYLAPMLRHADGRVRILTAKAFGELGNKAALPHLVAAGAAAKTLKRALPGGATRAHMAVVEQRAYVRDYDVEVAQASFIANPKVDIIQSGVVHDVTVIAVTTRRTELVDAYRGAIKRIVKADPGSKPADWKKLLEKEKAAKDAPKTPDAGK